MKTHLLALLFISLPAFAGPSVSGGPNSILRHEAICVGQTSDGDSIQVEVFAFTDPRVLRKEFTVSLRRLPGGFENLAGDLAPRNRPGASRVYYAIENEARLLTLNIGSAETKHLNGTRPATLETMLKGQNMIKDAPRTEVSAALECRVLD